jgi:hypothetical protein
MEFNLESIAMKIFAHNDNHYRQTETLQMVSVFLFWVAMSIYAIINLFSGEFLLALGWLVLSIPLGAVVYVLSTIILNIFFNLYDMFKC